MTKLTKGNYTPKKEPEAEEKKEEEKDWEREMLKKLGGSTAFVREKRLIEE